ncbi:MAG: 50S ribosomal protein L30 [Chloroflexi bacterium]|nr:MAG: 50S ribosomal protein L30 [Chloroflexota bacterium]
MAVAAERPKRQRARSPKSEDAPLRITLVHSTIGHKAAAGGTVRALGLHRLHQTVEIADTPVNRGMLRRVAFLLEVHEPERRGAARRAAGSANPSSAEAPSAAEASVDPAGTQEAPSAQGGTKG